jgi:serpin B
MVVMAMLHMGARKNTEVQIAKGLRLGTMDKKTLAKEMESFVGRLKESNQAVTLQTANKLFPHASKIISEDFIRLIVQHFRADVQTMDFTTRAEESRLMINTWVEQETRGKIKNLLPEGSINALTAMVVANAIYFKGNWKLKFNVEATSNAEFHISAQQTVTIPMMRQKFQKIRYSGRKDLGCQVIELPYVGDELGMVILLPDTIDGLVELEKKITPRILKDVMDKMVYNEITVHIPKFRLESSYKLKEILSALSMPDLFDERKADLSGIGQNLHVSNVFHKAFVDVNEEGTEAAAATGAVIALKSMLLETKFEANHPFMFMIWDHKLDVPLFIGRLVNPSA